jgi:hypothetical protein
LLEAQGPHEGADGPFGVGLGGLQDAVLARGGLDPLFRLGAGLLDEVVVGAQVQGAVVAVVDAGLLLIEARGEDLGLGQADGYRLALDPHVVLAYLREVDPGLDVARGNQRTFSPENRRSSAFSLPLSRVTSIDSVTRTVASWSSSLTPSTTTGASSFAPVSLPGAARGWAPPAQSRSG